MYFCNIEMKLTELLFLKARFSQIYSFFNVMKKIVIN